MIVGLELVDSSVVVAGNLHSGLGCFMEGDPSQDGPPAPSNFVAEIALPANYDAAEVEITWTDESSDETCIVLERRFAGDISNPFEVIAILPQDATAFRDKGPYQQGDWLFYRIYVATATARSDFATDDAYIPIVEPTPTPRPHPSPVMRGDINCDGSINPVDGLAILRYDAGLDPNIPDPDVCPPVDSVVNVVGVSSGAALMAAGAIAVGAGIWRSRRQKRPTRDESRDAQCRSPELNS
jgi:hypothetical protein